MRGLLFVLLAMAFATTAFAQPANLQRATAGFVYFNRLGADQLTHDSELRNCIETWNGGLPTEDGEIFEYGIVGNIVLDMMNSNWDRARRAVNIEHCMIVRGWQIVRLDSAQGERLARLERAALATEIAPFYGAATPPGEIVRVWQNDAGRPDTVIVANPQNVRRTMLSELALDVEAAPPERQVEVAANSWASLRRREVRPADLSDLSDVPAGMAVIVVSASASRADRRRAVLNLDRDSEEYEAWDVVQLDSRHLRLQGEVGQGIRAFVVRPGRWRLYGVSVLFDYCLGAPSAAVEAGQVVYLGHFDLSAQLRPDIEVQRASEFLADNPTLREALVPARWTNGRTWKCRMMSPYALEFEGFPFEAEYNWGGAAVLN